jgi:hypothetical protein
MSLITQSVGRARAMMQSSSNGGLYRRLNRNERLRAGSSTAPINPSKSTKAKKAKTVETKPFEYVLLMAVEDDDDEDNSTLTKDKILERGIVTLDENDNELTIRKKLVSSLDDKYPALNYNDFEFIKVTQKRISILKLGKGTEYSFSVVKKMAGQGLLYIRVKPEFQCLLDSKDYISDTDTVFDKATFDPKPSTNPQPETLGSDQHTSLQPVQLTVAATSSMSDIPDLQEKGSDNFFCKLIDEFPVSIVEPTEMLRYLQKKIVRGRPLELTDNVTPLQGESNFVTVDRESILPTTFEELKDIKDPRLTFDVQFYGEEAVDSGGPRKEWIRICNQNIKMKYFDNGLKDYLVDDYFFVGQMAGIALLQNGQIPKYFPEDILQAIFSEAGVQELSPCIKEMQRGLDTLGLVMFGKKFPIFLHLLRPSDARLTGRMLIHILKPNFAEEGSNRLSHEKAVYARFIRYVREVESGRRVVSLENILEFVTGASEEPPLGFGQNPSIEFDAVESKDLPNGLDEVIIIFYVTKIKFNNINIH